MANAPGRRDRAEPALPIWRELLVGIEVAQLRRSPVYYGLGIPRGDGAPVVVVPGLLATDFHLAEFRYWLWRIGYAPYASGIGFVADCPRLLLPLLERTIEQACVDTGRHVHLIGHSLGGLLARSAAVRIPRRIASVITIGAPIRGVAAHPAVLYVADVVRRAVIASRGAAVASRCFTGGCSCSFADSLTSTPPASIYAPAIYSRSDGVVDWRYCRTGDPTLDHEVPATHVGYMFNSFVYEVIARCLARATSGALYESASPAARRLA